MKQENCGDDFENMVNEMQTLKEAIVDLYLAIKIRSAEEVGCMKYPLILIFLVSKGERGNFELRKK